MVSLSLLLHLDMVGWERPCLTTLYREMFEQLSVACGAKGLLTWLTDAVR